MFMVGTTSEFTAERSVRFFVEVLLYFLSTEKLKKKMKTEGAVKTNIKRVLEENVKKGRIIKKRKEKRLFRKNFHSHRTDIVIVSGDRS